MQCMQQFPCVGNTHKQHLSVLLSTLGEALQYQKGFFAKCPHLAKLMMNLRTNSDRPFPPPLGVFFQNSSILQGRGFSILAFTLYTEKSKHRAFLNNNILLSNKDLLYFAPWSSLFRHFGFVFCDFLQMLFHQSTLVHSLILRVGLSWPTMRCYYYWAKIHCVQFLLHRWSSDANKTWKQIYLNILCLIWFEEDLKRLEIQSAVIFRELLVDWHCNVLVEKIVGTKLYWIILKTAVVSDKVK